MSGVAAGFLSLLSGWRECCQLAWTRCARIKMGSFNSTELLGQCLPSPSSRARRVRETAGLRLGDVLGTRSTPLSQFLIYRLGDPSSQPSFPEGKTWGTWDGFKDEEEAVMGVWGGNGEKGAGFSLKIPETEISKRILPQRSPFKDQEHQLCEGVGFLGWLLAVSPAPRTMPDTE